MVKRCWDYYLIYKNSYIYIHHDDIYDTALVWEVNSSGIIIIEPTIIVRGDTGEDGVNLYVNHNNTNIWSGFIDQDSSSICEFPQTQINVSRGDKIYFRINKNSNISNDTTGWNPIIKF